MGRCKSGKRDRGKRREGAGFGPGPGSQSDGGGRTPHPDWPAPPANKKWSILRDALFCILLLQTLENHMETLNTAHLTFYSSPSPSPSSSSSCPANQTANFVLLFHPPIIKLTTSSAAAGIFVPETRPIQLT